MVILAWHGVAVKLDFSRKALVKRYVNEIGSAWVQAICKSSANHIIALAHIELAEIAAALGVKYRQNILPRKSVIGCCGTYSAMGETNIGWSMWTRAWSRAR